MQARIYLNDGGEKTLLTTVGLEVVPGGTYVIDGIPYKLTDKPTFVIQEGVLQFVNLIVEKLP
jgi:hypothetical protein